MVDTITQDEIEPFQIRLARSCGVVVVTVTGELDMASDSLTDVLEQLAAGGSWPVVVDLSRLAFCDLRGLGSLLDGCARARGHGVEMVLAGLSPLQERMWRIVYSTGRVPAVEPARYVDVDAAVAALTLPPGPSAA